MKHTKKEMLLITLLIGVTLYLVGRSLSINDLRTLFHSLKGVYVVIAFSLLFAFWGLEAFMLGWLIKRVKKKRIPRWLPWVALKTTLVGQYYANITPFASGGQPAQLFVLQKYKVQPSEGTVVLVAKFLVFQITVTCYALTFFVLRHANIPVFALPFVTAGLLINGLGLFVISLGAFKPELLMRCIAVVIRNLRFSDEKSEAIINRINRFVAEYKNGMIKLSKEKKQTLGLFIMSIIQLTVFFSIPYMLSQAVGITGITYVEMLSLQSILYMAVSFIPIPGTVGVSEFGFITLLGHVMSNNLASILMLLWRFVSYYFSLIFCGLFTLMTTIFKKRSIYS